MLSDTVEVNKMIVNAEGWAKRANQILGSPDWSDYRNTGEAIQFAVSMLAALYGSQSKQLKAFLDGQDAISKMKPGMGNIQLLQLNHTHGAIKNAKEELEAGLIGSMRVIVAGEVLAELVTLGKEILSQKDEAGKNVSAVLIAAAYEDLMRRMGEEFATLTDRPKLEDVISALKGAGVLKGGQVALALSFLPFRNHSLHAEWNKVDNSQVESCISFVEALLLKHFS